jgi:hypothetical protein
MLFEYGLTFSPRSSDRSRTLCKFGWEVPVTSVFLALFPEFALPVSSAGLFGWGSLALLSSGGDEVLELPLSLIESHRFMFSLDVAREGMNLSDVPISECARATIRRLEVGVLLPL